MSFKIIYHAPDGKDWEDEIGLGEVKNGETVSFVYEVTWKKDKNGLYAISDGFRIKEATISRE